MKRILLIVILFSSLSIYAQSTRQYLGLTVGPSFPLSDFAKTDLSDSTSGFAKTGVNFKFLYSYRITHNFGIQAHFVYNSNFFDREALTSEVEKNIPDYSFSVESNQPWGNGGAYVGPFLSFLITENFSWDFRVLIGFTGGFSPQYIIRGTNLDSGEKTEYYREAAKSYGFGAVGGTGFKYRIKRYLILLNADYYYSNLNFKEITGWGWTSPDNPTGTPYVISRKQKTNTFAVTIGFAYFL